MDVWFLHGNQLENGGGRTKKKKWIEIPTEQWKEYGWDSGMCDRTYMYAIV